jgi:hypothetical protein
MCDVKIAVKVLNRMTELGRPVSIRVALWRRSAPTIVRATKPPGAPLRQVIVPGATCT